MKSIFSSDNSSNLLLIWVIVSVAIPNVWLSMVERLSVMQSIANIVLPVGVYMLLMSITRRIGRASLWMIIAFFFAAFQIVLLYMYGRSVIAVDMFLNVVTTNPGEVSELLGNMMVIIFCVVVIYIPPILMGIVAVRRHWRLSEKVIRTTRRLSLYTLAVGIVCFVSSFFNARPYRPLCDLYPVNVVYNLSTAIHRTVRVANYNETSSDFRYDAVSTRSDSVPEIYVVVVGETSRADNWQICGYDRPTTPRLMNRPGLVSFSKAISQSNTTHKSVPMLMSPLDASNFGDSIYNVKSLITAFKEAGFETAYFSAHSRNHSFIDFFGEEADTCIFIKEDGRHKEHYYDGDLLKYLDGQIANGNNKQLVVLHAYGSHFNYIDRYPADQAVFRPDRPAHATHHYRDKQINAYDNTILYTSNFLADIIDRLEKTPGFAAMIYTGDHGEDIFDDDRCLFLHASPIPSYYQVHVPLLVWMNGRFIADSRSLFNALESNSGKYVASSKAFFHTIMDLAGIATPQKRSSESVASETYRPRPAEYLNDHNESVPLVECGILEQDIHKLDSLQIPLR